MSAPTPPVLAAAPDIAAAEAVAVLMTQVSEGRLTAATMADRAMARMRELFAQCDGPTDVLWPVHVDICRAVLGHAGLSAAEVAQWLSVARCRESPAGAVDYPPGSVEAASEARSHDPGGAEPDAGADLEAVAQQVDSVDAVDNVDPFADVPDDVLAEAEAAALAVIDRYRRRETETR